MPSVKLNAVASYNTNPAYVDANICKNGWHTPALFQCLLLCFLSQANISIV